jgi:hypothetical protein
MSVVEVAQIETDSLSLDSVWGLQLSALWLGPFEVMDRYEFRGMKREVSNTANCQYCHICFACIKQFSISVVLLLVYVVLHAPPWRYEYRLILVD